ncbi:hypothetical protein PF002_g16116 [Phytophthora fragariae]|uniref:Uncharacterized protein n=1 Tax=Phytophthora fragariae TaxID=53985 RepID=A0A6A3YLK3_9STRA|nr:hypothetical protein PF002_g16116 [Phytophthora fragariae]
MVRVVSCRFMRISCSEDDHPLFRRYYARSNRERGVKLLRCFPHCCPEHVQRCYCGTSIHVMVTFNSEPPPAGLLVCARFEPSRVVPLWPSSLAEAPAQDDTNERKLRPGEIVSLSESLLPSGNRKAKQTTWIRADREGDTKQSSKNATPYVLNNHRYPKWLYTYDSSVTRTQREMTHHLVVYVCQSNATSKPQLQERFVLLLSDLYDELGDVLGEVTAEMVHRLRGNQALSLPALVDDVLSLVYSLPRFSALRVEVSTLLLSQEPVGSLSEALNCAFQTFVALAREAMIVPINMQHTKKYAQQQPLAARPGHNDPEWNQRWLLEPGSLQIAHVASGTAREALSLADFAQLVYEFGCIDINLADDRSSLSLQSAYSLSGGATTTPMTLVLDGRLRVFRALPSGISSMVSAAGGWSLGDYMATFSEDTHALNVDFFMFADVKTSAYSRGGRRTERHVSGSNSHDEIQMRRVNLSIKLEEDVSIGDSGDIFAFVCGTLYSSSYTPASMSVTERMQGLKLSETSTVDRATVWREAKWSPLWKLQTGYIVPRVGFV